MIESSVPQPVHKIAEGRSRNQTNSTDVEGPPKHFRHSIPRTYTSEEISRREGQEHVIEVHDRNDSRCSGILVFAEGMDRVLVDGVHLVVADLDGVSSVPVVAHFDPVAHDV